MHFLKLYELDGLFYKYVDRSFVFVCFLIQHFNEKLKDWPDNP